MVAGPRYFDTSALAKRYRVEPGTPEVTALLSGAIPFTSRLSEAEVISAVARWEREGRLSVVECDRVLRAVAADFRDLRIVEVSAEVISLVPRMTRVRGLRSGDAVQLASCLVLRERIRRSVEFISDDAALVAAARLEHLTVVQLGAT